MDILFTVYKGLVMFNNLACVFISPHDFLSYNDKVAGLFSDYRMTANAAIHREEGRKLTDKEIERLLKAVERMGVSVEERPPSNDEEDLIKDIQVYHPEVKYIIKSFKVEAVRGRKRQRKKETKKERERVRRQDKKDWEEGTWDDDEERSETREEKFQRMSDRAARQSKDTKKKKVSDREKEIRREEVEKKRAKRSEQYEDPDKFGPEKMEPGERQDLYKELKQADKGEKEYEGWQGFLMNMFDFVKNPELSKTQRLALRRNKKRVLRDLRKNYRNFEKIEKQLNENAGLVEYLNQGLKKDMFDPSSMAAFTELIRRDPEIVKALDIPDIRKDEKFMVKQEKIERAIKQHGNAGLVMDLEFFKDQLSDLNEEISLDTESGKISRALKKLFKDINVETKNIEILVDEDIDRMGERVVTIAGPVVPISQVKVDYDIKLNDLHNKNFWDAKRAG
jgi:hypothetical protein